MNLIVYFPLPFSVPSLSPLFFSLLACHLDLQMKLVGTVICFLVCVLLTCNIQLLYPYAHLSHKFAADCSNKSSRLILYFEGWATNTAKLELEKRFQTRRGAGLHEVTLRFLARCKEGLEVDFRLKWLYHNRYLRRWVRSMDVTLRNESPKWCFKARKHQCAVCATAGKRTDKHTLNTRIGFQPLKRLTLKTDCNVFLQNFDIYSQILTFSRLLKPFFIEDILTCCALQTSWLWVGFFKEIYSAFWRGFHWMWGKIKLLLLGVYVSLFL